MASKKSKNWFVYGTGFAVISIIALFFLFPGLGASIWSNLINQPSHCSETPYDSNCYCGEGFEQINFGGIPSYFICENEEKFIDIDLEGWEEEAITYTKLKLSEEFPDCDMRNCDIHGTDWFLSKTKTYTSKKRSIYITCEKNSLYFVESIFDIETGGLQFLRCLNYEDLVSGNSTEPAILKLNGGISEYNTLGYFQQDLSFTAKCNEIDNGIAYITVYSPEDKFVKDWYLCMGGYGLTYDENNNIWKTSCNTPTICTIINTNDNSATIKCDANCPALLQSGMSVNVFGFYRDKNYPACKSLYTCDSDTGICYDSVKYYYSGRKLCCNEDKSYHICQEDGTWYSKYSSAPDPSELGVGGCKVSPYYRCPGYD